MDSKEDKAEVTRTETSTPTRSLFSFASDDDDGDEDEASPGRRYRAVHLTMHKDILANIPEYGFHRRRAEKRLYSYLDNHSLEILQMLQDMDGDGSGGLSKQEVHAGLRSLDILSDNEIDLVMKKPFEEIPKQPDGTYKYHELLSFFRRGANKFRARAKLDNALKKLLCCIFIICPLVCVITSFLLGGFLALAEGWSFEDSVFLVMGEITQLDIDMTGDYQTGSMFGKMAASIVGIWCLAFLAMVIGIVAGPIIEPVQKALQLYPQDEEEEDVIANVDLTSISDPLRYTLRTVLMQQDQFDKVTTALGDLTQTIATMQSDISMLKSAHGLVDEDRPSLSKRPTMRRLKSTKSAVRLPKKKSFGNDFSAASVSTKSSSSSNLAAKSHTRNASDELIGLDGYVAPRVTNGSSVLTASNNRTSDL